jgi:hypothetical protein
MADRHGHQESNHPYLWIYHEAHPIYPQTGGFFFYECHEELI